jgi:hypothetical protein
MHVGNNGAIVGLRAAAFPNKSVNGLLDAWFNRGALGVAPFHPDKRCYIKIPHPVEGGVLAELQPTSANVIPFSHIGRDRTVYGQWPSTATAPSTVSPEMESAVDPVLSPPESTLSLRGTPFESLKPLLSTMDDLYTRDRMRLIAELSGKDAAEEQAQAAIEARDWLSKGRSTLARTWLEPIISAEGEMGALFAIASRFGIEVNSLTEALSSASLRKKLDQPMPVQRAWGVPGLMWALLLERLVTILPVL